jgi:hypothetical protein
MKTPWTFRLGWAGLAMVLGCSGDYPGGTVPQTPSSPQNFPAPVSQSPSPAAALSIHLSAGTALPQTGPEGTMMGFSVDYEFDQGQPQPSETFVWVIERTQGEPARISRRLTANGNLSTDPFLPWRPEQGPFRTHIEDSSGHPVSETVDLRAP